MLSKGELKKLFFEHSLRPRKRWGQNFLIDGNVKDKIIEEAGLKNDDVVLEIGSGLGALTFDLAKKAKKVLSVERDRKLFDILKDISISEGRPDNLELICDDILRKSMKDLARDGKLKVIGNLPYYITTPIITFLIDNRKFIDTILITVQREVARRLLAAPKTRDYGCLTCFVQYYTSPRYVRTIKRTCFYPAPSVDSSLVMLKVRDFPRIRVEDEGLLFSIIRKGFNQRRKVILNALTHKSSLGVSKDALLGIFSTSGTNPRSRADEMALEDFAKIANNWRN